MSPHISCRKMSETDHGESEGKRELPVIDNEIMLIEGKDEHGKNTKLPILFM